MSVVGYTKGACAYCLKHKPVDNDEFNPVRAILDNQDEWDQEPSCDVCLEAIPSHLTLKGQLLREIAQLDDGDMGGKVLRLEEFTPDEFSGVGRRDDEVLRRLWGSIWVAEHDLDDLLYEASRYNMELEYNYLETP